MKGALIVNTDQPKGKMVKVLFEPKAKLSDSLTYDITAWSIPYAYGLKAVASKTVVPANQSATVATSFINASPNATGAVSLIKPCGEFCKALTDSWASSSAFNAGIAC